MTKILITGSEGLIGSLLCKKLSKKYKIVRFDKKLGHDILNYDQIKRKMKGCDGVLHLAAMSRVITAHQKPKEAVENNIIGTTNILECIRKNNPKIWCVYGSSREVYGETKKKVSEALKVAKLL